MYGNKPLAYHTPSPTINLKKLATSEYPMFYSSWPSTMYKNQKAKIEADEGREQNRISALKKPATWMEKRQTYSYRLIHNEMCVLSPFGRQSHFMLQVCKTAADAFENCSSEKRERWDCLSHGHESDPDRRWPQQGQFQSPTETMSPFATSGGILREDMGVSTNNNSYQCQAWSQASDMNYLRNCFQQLPLEMKQYVQVQLNYPKCQLPLYIWIVFLAGRWPKRYYKVWSISRKLFKRCEIYMDNFFSYCHFTCNWRSHGCSGRKLEEGTPLISPLNGANPRLPTPSDSFLHG